MKNKQKIIKIFSHEVKELKGEKGRHRIFCINNFFI